MPRINADLSGVTEEDMQGTWKALPDGDYICRLIESDYKETNKGDGMCLHLKWQCIEPGHSRAKPRDFLTLEHPNADTVKIARARLKQIAIAVGHPNPDYVEKSEELHEVPVLCRISREQAEDPRYGDLDGYQNRIVAYLPVKEGAPPVDKNEPPPIGDNDIPF